MEFRVYHPDLISTDVGVNCSRVIFDENGISAPMSETDFNTFLSIPGYMSLDDYMDSLAQADLDMFLAEPQDALVPEAEAPEVTDDTDQEIPEHEEDLSIYDTVFTAADPAAAFHSLPLEKRLDLASDPRLTEAEAQTIFDWESKQRKSKRVLAGADRRLGLMRQSKSALSVTNALLQANFPAHVES